MFLECIALEVIVLWNCCNRISMQKLKQILLKITFEMWFIYDLHSNNFCEAFIEYRTLKVKA